MKSDGILLEPKEQVLWIRLNRPEKYNALLGQMYEDLTSIFTKVNKDDSIKALVLTGNGEYYSSGNDLSNLSSVMKDPEGFMSGMTRSKEILIDFVDSLICLEKFSVAAVNGPAVGIPVTTLPLFDYVIASDKATFQTPFTSLGQCPEACSSHTFPQLLGRAKASELLMLNMKWDAQTAMKNGLIADVISHDKFHQHLEKLVKSIEKSCYPTALKVGKSLVMDNKMKQQLMEVNRRESEALFGCWLGSECMDAVQKFFKRK